MSEPSLSEKLVAIHLALDQDDLPHAFGGAIALAYYGEPRVTIDVDCNVFVSAEELVRVAGVLSPLGIDFGRLEPRGVVEDGLARVPWGRNPVDLFFSYDPFHDAMQAAVRRVPFGDVFIPILGPEHLVVCKAMFDRPKDWLDIPQVLVGVEGFDANDVRRWLDAMVGSDDQRRVHFDELAHEMLGR
jgi:hypothetical protein